MLVVKPRSCAITVLIPVSILATEHRKDLKTLLVSHVLRFCSIFRVSRIVVYRDPHAAREDLKLFIKVSKYLLTPPYLRRKLIPLDRDLKYVGLVPPLALPLHSVKKNEVMNTLRLGIVEHVDRDSYLAFVGLDKPCRVESYETKRVGDTAPLIVVRDAGEYYECKEVTLESLPLYTGPRIEESSSLFKALTSCCTNGLIIEFTRIGKNPLELKEVLLEKDYDKICCVFGSPYLDAHEILRQEVGIDFPSVATGIGSRHIAIDAVVNQGVRSIRSVEALAICLSILNFALLETSRCL